MAKRRSKTAELKSKIRRQIRTLEKRGFIISDELKQRLDQANYARLKSYEKSQYKRLYSEIEYKDYFSGETVSGTKGRLIRRSGGARRQQDLIDKFYKDKGYEHGDVLPDKADQVITTVIDELIGKLQQNVPEYYYDSHGKKRWIPPEKRTNIEQKKTSLINQINAQVAAGKGQQLAQRLEENVDNIALFVERLFSYFDDEVSAAYSALSRIINDGAMSLDQMSDDDAYSDYVAGYAEPD